MIPQTAETGQACRTTGEVTGFAQTGAGRRMQTGMLTVVERVRWAGYGLVAGLVMGLFLGWMFHGFVGTMVRLVIVAIILAPFIAALIFWVKVSNKNRADRTETGIQDAEWRDINTR
jgi:predicted lipid-binding transport protein (Tim44 family)